VSWLLLGTFTALMLAAVPVSFAMGFAAILVIMSGKLGILAVPTNFYASIASYPLLTIPMFVLAGTIFERSGVALRLVRFAMAIVGNGPGALGLVAVVVGILMGGISGSAAAITAAVASILAPTMLRKGYPPAYSASIISAGATTDILVPPSITLIIYSVLVPQATTMAMFAAGIIPGTLAALLLLIPAWGLARIYGFGAADLTEPRPPFWTSLREAFWGLLAKFVILGGLRFGIFTPTEAAVVAVFYCLFVGIVIYRSISVRDIYRMLVEAVEVSGIILVVIAFSGVFAWAINTLGIIDPFVSWVIGLDLNQYGVLALLVVMLVFVGIFLDGVSIVVVMVPLLVPIAVAMKWDLVWFGVLLTLMVAVGQVTPPIAVNLMIACKIAGARIEDTVGWSTVLLVPFIVTIALVVAFPELALWLPRYLGY
jgi:C4-dicarboxylate transporter, DctM subunit